MYILKHLVVICLYLPYVMFLVCKSLTNYLNIYCILCSLQYNMHAVVAVKVAVVLWVKYIINCHEKWHKIIYVWRKISEITVLEKSLETSQQQIIHKITIWHLLKVIQETTTSKALPIFCKWKRIYLKTTFNYNQLSNIYLEGFILNAYVCSSHNRYLCFVSKFMQTMT